VDQNHYTTKKEASCFWTPVSNQEIRKHSRIPRRGKRKIKKDPKIRGITLKVIRGDEKGAVLNFYLNASAVNS
jgi:hypothetical protein